MDNKINNKIKEYYLKDYLPKKILDKYLKFFFFCLQSFFNLISLVLRYYSEETGPRDPDSKENGQKKKGEKISESKSTAQEGYL